MADTLKLTPHETLTIQSASPEALEVEAVYGPGGSPPPAHLHPAQDEHFEVLAGEMRVRLDGQERALSAGESLDIPRLQKHQMWNPGGQEARVLWRTSPALRTEQWFRAVDRLVREAGGKTPGPLAFGVLLAEYDDVFRLAAGPESLMRPVVGAMGALGRLRGHRA